MSTDRVSQPSGSGSDSPLGGPRMRPVIESSDSDSNSCVETRQKRLKRLSMSSDCSGDSVLFRVKRPARIDSETSSESSWESAHSIQDSDSSEGNSDKCPICLMSLSRRQELGTPESCDHLFCLECLLEWSKNMNTCPVDRQEYSLVLVRKKLLGKIVRKIEIAKPNTAETAFQIIEDPTNCEVCGRGDREDQMLLCDGCDNGYHMDCLTPRMSQVPEGAWFCDDCAPQPERLEADFAILNWLLDQAETTTRRINNTRRMPRTGRSERVRRQIASNRRNAEQARAEPSRRRAKRRKKPRYRTVYTVDENTGETVATKKLIKRRKKKKKLRKKAAVATTVKKRLARHLGICKPTTTFQSLPDVKITNSGCNAIATQRYNAGIQSLDLFGTRDELNFSDWEESDDGLGVGGVVARRRMPNSHDVDALRRRSRAKAAVTVPTITSTSGGDGGSVDLLGSILDSQAKFHSKRAVLSLSENGRVVVENQERNRGENSSENAREKQANSVGENTTLGRHNTGGNRPGFGGNQSNFRGGNTSYGGGGNYRNSGGNRGSNFGGNYRGFGGNSSNYGGNYQGSNYGGNYTNYGSGGYNKNYGGPPNPRRNRPNYSNYKNTQRPQMNQSAYEPVPSTSEDRRTADESFADDMDMSTPTSTVTNTNAYGSGETQEGAASGQQGNDESEVDIYSDIETVTTSKTGDYDDDEELPLQPPPLPPFDMGTMSTMGTSAASDSDNDSEPNLCIDTQKQVGDDDDEDDDNDRYRPDQPCDDSSGDVADTQKEADEVVTSSTVYPTAEVAGVGLATVTSVSGVNVTSTSEDDEAAVQSTSSQIVHNRLIPEQDDWHADQDDDDDDGCPNFSIYSSESKDLAKNLAGADVTAPIAESNNDQVGEVSSSPTIAEKQTNADDQNDDIVSSTPPQPTTEEEEHVDKDRESEMEKLEEEAGRRMSNPPSTPPLISREENKRTSPSPTTSGASKSPAVEENKRYTPTLEDEENQSRTPPSVIREKRRQSPSSEVGENKGRTPSPAFGENKSRSPSPSNCSKSHVGGTTGGLYSDSEDETVVKIQGEHGFGSSSANVANLMTEDIVSEEERSTTPMQPNERNMRLESTSGLDGLDTEMISDDCNDDFEPTKKAAEQSRDDGGALTPPTTTTMASTVTVTAVIDMEDALEINAKENELDMMKADEYEEGEIVDKMNKTKQKDQDSAAKTVVTSLDPAAPKRSDDDPETSAHDRSGEVESNREANKENEQQRGGDREKGRKESAFKKLKRGANKNRNYRDERKQRRSRSTERHHHEENRRNNSNKAKRNEIERYNVRAVVADKPKRDEFGRDLRRSSSSQDSHDGDASPSLSPVRRRNPSPPVAPSGGRSHSRSPLDRSQHLRRRNPSPPLGRHRSRSRSIGLRRGRSPGSRSPPLIPVGRRRSPSPIVGRRRESPPGLGRRRDASKQRRSRSGSLVRRRSGSLGRGRSRSGSFGGRRSRSGSLGRRRSRSGSLVRRRSRSASLARRRDRTARRRNKIKRRRRGQLSKSPEVLIGRRRKKRKSLTKRHKSPELLLRTGAARKTPELGRNSRLSPPPEIMMSGAGRRHQSRRSPSPVQMMREHRQWRMSPWSRSRSPVDLRQLEQQQKKQQQQQRVQESPSWTPPHLLEQRNLRVYLAGLQQQEQQQQQKKKKKEKRKKGKDGNERPTKKKKRSGPAASSGGGIIIDDGATPPPQPAKEVFASGDNILVSVSFNKSSDDDDHVTITHRNSTGGGVLGGATSASSSNARSAALHRRLMLEDNVAAAADSAAALAAAAKKNKRPKKRVRRVTTKRARELASAKPVAIIDLERSPFKEMTPSPKEIIVLSDSDNETGGAGAGKEKGQNAVGSENVQQEQQQQQLQQQQGPKTPPEAQVKFTLANKTQVRPITNPLAETASAEEEDDDLEDLERSENGNNRSAVGGNAGGSEGGGVVMETASSSANHKGPNTPPEPPTSPPSSPDAYDPFEPTKSRSATPTDDDVIVQTEDDRLRDELIEQSVAAPPMIVSANAEKQTSSAATMTTATSPMVGGVAKTPPMMADIQPADSQSSIQVTSESSMGKSPTENHSVQTQTTPKSSATQTIPLSSACPSILISSSGGNTATLNLSATSSLSSAASRINIINSAIIQPAQQQQQRLVLPNILLNPVTRISPVKPQQQSTVKTSTVKTSTRKNRGGGTQNAAEMIEALGLDSPYSPGSSDYEDLFEPPASEASAPPTTLNTTSTKSKGKAATNTKSPSKAGAFDALFITSPYQKVKKAAAGGALPTKPKKGPKYVGVKVDEDSLKILDELPNSAVEMQVKDKFLKKLNRQERVVEEVKLVLKPHYNKKHLNKEEYKDVLRRAVPKICHNKSGEINPTKIKHLVEAYVRKVRHNKKVTSSSSAK